MTDLYFEKVKLILQIAALVGPFFHETYTKNWKKNPWLKSNFEIPGEE